MKVERLNIKACCGKTKLALKIASPLSKDILPLLVGNGFIESKKFTQAGMLYVENDGIVASGPFGSNIINILCKINNCINFINDFEAFLINLE